MKRIRIALTEWQKEMLGPLFKKVHGAYHHGKPGAIMAQIWDGCDSDGKGYLEARFVDEEEVLCLRKANCVKAESLPKPVPVRVPIEESEVK